MSILRAPVLLRFSTAIAVASLVACGGGEEEPAEQAAPSQPATSPAPAPRAEAPTAPAPAPQDSPAASRPAPPRDDRSVGEQLRDETEIPSYYPGDAPVYPGANAARASTKNGRASVMFGTSDTPAQVASYMSDFLSENGWAPVSQSDRDRVLMQGKKSGRQITILVAQADQGASSEITMIAVSVDE